MSVTGTVQVKCPACGLERAFQLVQSINTRSDPEAKERLLAGELDVLACSCGKRTQLAANLLFHDPDAEYWCQVCPGGEAAMMRAVEAFRGAGATGVLRLVPSQNALIEKVKLVDAGLEDWAIEMAKVLLLASIEVPDLDRVLLFDRALDDVIHWVLFDAGGGNPQEVASPLSAYGKLAARTNARPAHGELRIDRAWAVAAVQAMFTRSN